MSVNRPCDEEHRTLGVRVVTSAGELAHPWRSAPRALIGPDQ